MRRTMLRAKTAGFTLIELVVVIVILGLLAATALPRFLDLTSDAQKATVQAVTGGLSSAVGIAHAKWAVNGSPSKASTATLDSTIVNLTSKGWPVSSATTAGTPTIIEIASGAAGYTGLPQAADFAVADQMCVDIWNTNLAGGRPSIEIEKFTTQTTHDTSEIEKNTSDYAARAYKNAATINELTKCEYRLVKKPAKVITYDLSTGEVSVVNN